MPTLTAPRTSRKASRTRKAKVRTVNMPLALNRHGKNGVMTIIENGKPTTFHLDRECAPESFTLTKFAGCVRDDGDEVYSILIGEQHSCECKGHLQHGHKTICRHVAAVRALVAAGKV